MTDHTNFISISKLKISKRSCLICSDKTSKHYGKLCHMDASGKCIKLCQGDGMPGKRSLDAPEM